MLHVPSAAKALITALMGLLIIALPSVGQQPATPEQPPNALVPGQSSVQAEPAPEPESLPEETVESTFPGRVPELQKEQGQSPMPEMNLGEPEVEAPAERPFWQDARIKLHLRNYYFNRERYDDSKAEAWAQGVDVSFKSGYFLDRFAIGAVLYSSLKLEGDDYKQGNGLLDSDLGDYRLRFNYSRDSGWSHFWEQPVHQDSFVVLGQIYGEFKILDSLQLSVGRREYNTPYVNMHDVRMVPKTFEGISLAGSYEPTESSEWRYGVGYLTKMKGWTDSTFHSMSDSIGVEDDRGLYVGGVNYSAGRWSLGAIDYYMSDVINIFYTEGSYEWELSPKSSLKLSAQFSNESSVGDNLIYAPEEYSAFRYWRGIEDWNLQSLMDLHALTHTEDFDVHQYGIKADLQYGPAILTLAYTDVGGDDVDMRSPWGGYPGYTSVQVTDFNRAGEDAFMVKGGFDFTQFGLDGVSAYALWVGGSGRDQTSDAEVYDEDEWNLNLQWAPKEGRFKDLSVRVRYAEIEQDGGGDPEIEDFRVIVNYTFGVK